MERRMLLAVVLSFVAVTAWSLLFAPKPKPAPPEGPGANGPEVPGQGDPAIANPPGGPAAPTEPAPGAPGADSPQPAAGPGAAPAPAGVPQPQADVPESTETRTSPELEVTFSSRGGGVAAVRLRKALDPSVDQPFDLIVPVAPDLLLGQTDDTYLRPDVAPGGAKRKNEPPGPQRTLNWTRDEAAEARTPEDDVVYTFDTADGLRLRKRWTMPADERAFHLRLTLSAQRLAGAGAAVVPLKMLVASGMLREAFEGTFGRPNTIVVMRQGDDDPSGSSDLVHGMPVIDIPLEGIPNHLRFLGAHSNYFLTAFYADTINGNVSPVSAAWATGEEADQRAAMEARLVAWFRDVRGRNAQADESLAHRIQGGIAQMHHAWVVVDVPVAAADAESAPGVDVRLFLGPSDRTVLAQDEYAPLRPVLTYPSAPDFVTRILLWIYDRWNGLFGSAGLAVIFMTLTVRGGLMPISIRNQLSMRRYSRKVAKVKPKLTQLQAKHANNPKKLREEQMKLYREHGIGFPSGCLMMLIQIPIFFALFSGLRTEYTLWGEPFLWIKDLAGPDKLIPFGRTLIDLGLFRLDALNILPILMVVVSILHQRSMPKPADEQQAQQMRMMKWMPIFFAFLLYNYTAALALYMVFSAAIGLLEARIVRAKDAADVAADAAPA